MLPRIESVCGRKRHYGPRPSGHLAYSEATVPRSQQHEGRASWLHRQPIAAPVDRVDS
jgi:hypothetical protein